MSKLLKALEKATDRKDANGFVPREAPAQDRLGRAYEKVVKAHAESGEALPSVPFKSPGNTEIKPNYTRTEVLTTSERVLESNRIMTQLTDSRVKDYYDLLRTQVLQRTRAKGWNSLMITSIHSNEGKTTTSINLALAIARQVQQTALLVGANFRNPKILTYLGFDENRPGLSDYLLHDAQLQDLLFSPGVDKMVVLPTGQSMATTDILGSPRMKELVQELKAKYPDRYVIYDTPCVLNMPDTLVFSSYMDAVLMVVEAGRTPRQDIQQAVQTLEEHGVNIIGMVLNKANYN